MHVALVYNQKKEDHLQPATDVHGELAIASLEALQGSAHPATFSSSHAPLSGSTPANDLYAEWDSVETIHAVRDALAELHQVSMIEANEDAFERLRTERPQIVFNIAEGLYGISREAQMPAIFEMLRIPYSGSDPLTLAICLDKSRAKEILAHYGVQTPGFMVVNTPEEMTACNPSFPAMVKPLHEGSSKGIFNSSVVNDAAGLRRELERVLFHYKQPALVEEFLPGREFTVAMLGNGPHLNVLPIVEIKFDSLPDGVNKIYSYEAKWIWDTAAAPLEIFQCPADLTDSLRVEIETLCRKAYTVLRCRDWSRIDVRLDANGRPHIIELNPLPGILPKPEDNSCFPKAARAAGLSYNRLMQSVIAFAAERHGVGARTGRN